MKPRRSATRTWWGALLIGALVGSGLLASTASAEPANRALARKSYQRGTQDYNLGDFDKALEDFKDAYRNFEDATFLFNIAQCQRQLGKKKEAILSYRAFLREKPEAPNRVEVQHVIDSLEQSLREEEATKNAPPAGVATPASAPVEAAPPAPAPAPSTTASLTASPPPHTPIYKKWWLWTGVVAVVGIGVGVGLGVGLTREKSHENVFPQVTFP